MTQSNPVTYQQDKIFSFNNYLITNYSEKNISEIFKNINNRWDHYTNKGFSILTEETVALIKN